MEKQFLEWLSRDIAEMAIETEEFEKVLSWPLIINCYCKENNIRYG